MISTKTTRATHSSAHRLTVMGVTALFAMGLIAIGGCSVEPLEPTSTFSEPTNPSPDQEPAAKSNPAGSGEKVTQKIDNATGGTISTSDGTKLEVPPGALPPGVETITVTSSTERAPAAYATVSPVFVFEPEGTVFLKPLKVTMAFELPEGKSASNLTILWSRFNADGFDMVPSEFAPVAGSTTKYVVTGEVTHFSKGMCGEKFAVDPQPAPDPYK